MIFTALRQPRRTASISGAAASGNGRIWLICASISQYGKRGRAKNGSRWMAMALTKRERSNWLFVLRSSSRNASCRDTSRSSESSRANFGSLTCGNLSRSCKTAAASRSIEANGAECIGSVTHTRVTNYVTQPYASQNAAPKTTKNLPARPMFIGVLSISISKRVNSYGNVVQRIRGVASHVMLHGNAPGIPLHITLGKGARPPLHPRPVRALPSRTHPPDAGGAVNDRGGTGSTRTTCGPLAGPPPRDRSEGSFHCRSLHD